MKINKLNQSNIPIVQKLAKQIMFDENNIISSRMVIIDNDFPIKYQKCLYTVVKDGGNVADPMQDTIAKCMDYCKKNKLRFFGEAYIKMLLICGKNNTVDTYLEVIGYVDG